MVVEREKFWVLRKRGMTPSAIAAELGISITAVWQFGAERGGVAPRAAAPESGRFLSADDRDVIAVMRAEKATQAQIAQAIGKHPSTVSRELKRNSELIRSVRQINASYLPGRAHKRAQARKARPKVSKLCHAVNPRLHDAVELMLKDLLSPEQIANRLPRDFPEDPEMRVSHETIYQALYVESRGALKRELTAALRTGRAVRRAKKSSSVRRGRIPDMVNIKDRPAEVEARDVPGHWEGDLIIGKDGKSAIGTLVERTTRYVMLLHLPGIHGAFEVERAMLDAIQRMPEDLRKTVTWDQGIEMANHKNITIGSGVEIYFCDPHSPWQRGSNENTNGLLRQWFPKGTDLSIHSAERLREVSAQLNRRPRKTLEWRNPHEALNELLVATTA